jgi:hypothetical protein
MKGGDKMKKSVLRGITWYLVVAMFIIGIAPKVDAGFAPSEIIAGAQISRDLDIERIQNVIETKMVRDRLEKLGFTPEEIRSRLDRLDDQQVHQLALQIDEVKAGGDVLGVIIALLVIGILVVLLLQLTGHKVFIR